MRNKGTSSAHAELASEVAVNAVLSFGDASRDNRNEIDDIEVLAAVPENLVIEDVILPEFELKYGYFEVLQKRNPAEAERWKRLLHQADIYIFDPKDALGRVYEHHMYQWLRSDISLEAADWWASNELYNEVIWLIPEVWLSLMDVQDDIVLVSMGGFDAANSQANRLHEAAKKKLVNMRRLMLQSQHLYQPIIDRRPEITTFDETKEEKPWSLTPTDLMQGLSNPVVYDEGHSKDPLIHHQGRSKQYGRLSVVIRSMDLPDSLPAPIALADSKSDIRIQVADMAADYARDLWHAQDVNELYRFRTIWLNGTWMQPPRPSKITLA